MQVWGFVIVAGVWLGLAACGAGALGLALLPMFVWTLVLYVRCTRRAIKGRHCEKD